MIPEDKKLEFYYDHYKDSFQQLAKYLDNRIRYFLISLVLIVFLFLITIEPNTMNSAFIDWLSKQIGTTAKIDFAYVNHFLLFSLLWVLILYFQSVLTIEKSYKYIHFIEDELTKQMNPYIISREGKFYLGEKPKFVKLIGWFYKILFPLTVILSIFSKLVFELKDCWNSQLTTQHLIIDLVLSFMIISITVLYGLWQYRSKIKRRIEKMKKITS
jgi:hypothetical protein